MPLVRFKVRNEYGLGNPELYNAKNSRNDYDLRRRKDNESKEILDGVAVAGLVGILRQLGDLAQLVSDIFQDLHEQVMVTSARRRKLSTRIQNIEANLPLLENAIKGQRSHIHFAYVAGCDWRGNLRFEQSQLISTDLPQYMIDSYEDCRNPPRLYLLDKFDISGNGACLKRYSDPSYFRTVRAAFELEKAEKVQGEKRAHELKRKGSQLTDKESQQGSNEENQQSSLLARHFSSTHITHSNADDLNFSPDAAPISATRQKADLESSPSSFDSRSLDTVEPIQESNSLGPPDEPVIDSPCISKSPINQEDNFASNMYTKLYGTRTRSSSPSVTWDEKTEILEPVNHHLSRENIPVDETQSESTQVSSEHSDMESDISAIVIQEAENVISGNSANVQNNVDEITSETENYADALYTLESETETDFEYQNTHVLKSAKDTVENFDSSMVSEEPLVQPQEPLVQLHSDTMASLYPNSFVDIDNQITNDNNYIVNDQNQVLGICNSSTISEMSNAGVASMAQCFVEEKECNKTMYHLITPYLTENIQNPNIFLDTQISNRDSMVSEAVSDQPTESNTCSSTAILEHDTHESKLQNSPCNENLNESAIEVAVANDHAPKPCVFNSATMLESNTNVGKPTNSTPVYTSSIPTPMLWTNGFLLGLAPSKPPVFSVSNESNGDSFSYAATQDLSTGNPSCDESDNVIQQVSQNGFGNNHTELQPTESSQSTVDIKSSLSFLAQRILANSMQREPSIARTQSETVSPDLTRPQNNIVVSETCFTDGVKSSKTTVQLNSQVSGNSSPPLEHMKISFHPMNCLETSKLNLEYATGDLPFPSFQLLPKSDNHTVENVSETDDDDTFCRSDRYTSEDHESNSEMWEQDDFTGDSNDDTYNDVNRMSLSSSVSSFKGFFQVGHRKPTYEVENLELGNSTVYPHKSNHVKIPALDSFVYTGESWIELPPPLPLPPVHGRTTKGSFGEEVEKESCVAEIVEHFNDMHLQSLTAHEQHEQNPSMTHPFPETMHGTQKLSGHAKQISISNGQEVNETEELLLQIRNKSFNLRRSSTAKPSTVSLPSPNTNVIAILEKATAIRKAFESTEGDDDNWSCS